MSLDTLKAEIDTVGNQIRELKSSGGDVGSLVARLNELKKEYADNNGGIGVDGKPYQAPLSKAEKKKLEKEKKAAVPNKEVKVSTVPCRLVCYCRLLVVAGDVGGNEFVSIGAIFLLH